MAISVETLALAKTYTDETAIQFGGLKGAPCTIKSIVKQDGQNIVTFEWKNDAGDTRESILYVDDGTPIYTWEAGNHYNYGDLVIYASCFYRCIFENSDSVFDDTKWNELGSPDGNYDIVETKDLLPPRFTPADRKMYYCIADSAFYLWDGTKWVFQATGALGDDLDVTKTVGGVTSGSHYEEGTSVEKILRDMLNPTEYPTLTNPSASISSSIAKLLEKGSSVSAVLTVNFNRGSINPAYGTSGKRSGAATGYTMNGGAEQTSNKFNVVVNETYDSFTANVKYAAGEQPKDSTGKDYSTPLPAGNVNSSAFTYEFVNALWSNSASITTIAKNDLVSASTGTFTFNFPAATVANPETFDVPSEWTVSAIEVYNTISGTWDDCANTFTKSTTTHNNAGGTAVTYNRYTNNLGYNMDARKIRIKW